MARRSPTSFHSRFDIQVDRETAENHFINRVINFISFKYPFLQEATARTGYERLRNHQLLAIANSLGERFNKGIIFAAYVREDFFRCLQALESLYPTLGEQEGTQFTEQLEFIISQAEVDLGIRWKNGNFLPTGAKLLDEALVNANLHWLSGPSYQNVLAPFQKGLSEFLQGQRDPNKLIDAVRDMYEALEAMAKVTTGRTNKDLSANRQLFVSKLGLSNYYAKMLSDYIDYACKFRHALEAGPPRTPPPFQEVEAFIYTTGLFIRLALQSTT